MITLTYCVVKVGNPYKITTKKSVMIIWMEIAKNVVKSVLFVIFCPHQLAILSAMIRM
ncbi:hypothetical protein FM106_27260 [Brachybacterium faecium]|nr:hypothetical protein FM106_27260 [Brachybacterium faecium]